MDGTSVKSSGLKILEDLAQTRSHGSPIGETMGMLVSQVTAGEITLEVQPGDRHLNPLGVVHGGFAATCLDGAAALALFSTLEADTGYATVDLNVKYLRPLRKEQTYLAKGWVVDRTKRLVICDADIRDATGKLFAKATATLMVMV